MKPLKKISYKKRHHAPRPLPAASAATEPRSGPGTVVHADTIRYRDTLNRQRRFFAAGGTRPLAFRRATLKLLRRIIRENESLILDALHQDLRKSAYEAYLTEIAIVYQEIDTALRHLRAWARPRRRLTTWVLAPSSSRQVPEPYGSVLVIAPWNYPFQLAMVPVVSALAAGNTVMLKPSSLAPHTARAMAAIIGEAFDRSVLAVADGNPAAGHALLDERFDYIFFTGGTETGRRVMTAAARHLTPVTLELGGKSPVIVEADAAIDDAARKIAWGKFLNAGQTCLAPDYLLVHESVKERLLEGIARHVRLFYGDDPRASGDYGRIVSEGEFRRIRDLIGSGRPVIGGDTDETERYIAPTVLDGVKLTSPVMEREIFGPLLPVLTYENLDEALRIVKGREKPLALYLFTGSRSTERRVITETSSGGVVVNDVVIHVGNHHLPFGGVGASGMGAYHGRAGFDTFTHYKSVMKKWRFFENPLRFPPYPKTPAILRRIFG